MDILEILHHFVTHLSTRSMVCLVLSGIAWLALMVLCAKCELATPVPPLLDHLIACILPFGVMMMYLATCMLPIIVTLLVLTAYVISLLMIWVMPPVSSGKR